MTICPVCFERISVRFLAQPSARAAFMDISVVFPDMECVGWWTMMCALGIAQRNPGSPADSKIAPMDSACPMHTVYTGGDMLCMTS